MEGQDGQNYERERKKRKIASQGEPPIPSKAEKENSIIPRRLEQMDNSVAFADAFPILRQALVEACTTIRRQQEDIQQLRDRVQRLEKAQGRSPLNVAQKSLAESPSLLPTPTAMTSTAPSSAKENPQVQPIPTPRSEDAPHLHALSTVATHFKKTDSLQPHLMPKTQIMMNRDEIDMMGNGSVWGNPLQYTLALPSSVHGKVVNVRAWLSIDPRNDTHRSTQPLKSIAWPSADVIRDDPSPDHVVRCSGIYAQDGGWTMLDTESDSGSLSGGRQQFVMPNNVMMLPISGQTSRVKDAIDENQEFCFIFKLKTNSTDPQYGTRYSCSGPFTLGDRAKLFRDGGGLKVDIATPRDVAHVGIVSAASINAQRRLVSSRSGPPSAMSSFVSSPLSGRATFSSSSSKSRRDFPSPTVSLQVSSSGVRAVAKVDLPPEERDVSVCVTMNDSDIAKMGKKRWGVKIPILISLVNNNDGSIASFQESDKILFRLVLHNGDELRGFQCTKCKEKASSNNKAESVLQVQVAKPAKRWMDQQPKSSRVELSPMNFDTKYSSVKAVFRVHELSKCVPTGKFHLSVALVKGGRTSEQTLWTQTDEFVIIANTPKTAYEKGWETEVRLEGTDFVIGSMHCSNETKFSDVQNQVCGWLGDPIIVQRLNHFEHESVADPGRRGQVNEALKRLGQHQFRLSFVINGGYHHIPDKDLSETVASGGNQIGVFLVCPWDCSVPH